MGNTISIWDAIREMREITGMGKTFSMTFMSYDRGRQKSSGVVTIARARLRNATPKEQNQNAHHMLNFLDVDRNQPKQMYLITMMELNEKKIIVL
ncbi:MAG: hypothetical protein BWX87_00692 [Bacteroidetes bacterium ADurb.Bin123]|jgi:hypothetical protein|nr:MAG: hypothetical protein BWX87_00692 [Bacteroidetes bacterium ADurb.Bin123]